MAAIQATIETRELLWAVAESFLIALVATPIVRDIFRAYNVVDRPGIRKVHAYPIPRLGGISIAAAYTISLLGWLPDRSLAWRLLPGAAVIFVTGILDDFFNLSPRLKLAGQMAAACLAFANGFAVPIGPPALSGVLTVGWLLLTVNAFNLVDGLDGFCGGMGLIASGAAFVAGLIRGNTLVELATLPLVGALLGFLCHNFSRATVFLGDSGALLVGFLAGCFGLMWSAQAAGRIAMLAPILAFSIPLLDVALSVARRFLRASPIFSPDRGHIHHRLLDRGFSAQRAVSVLYLWSALGAGFALLLSHRPFGVWRWFGVAGYCLATWAGVRQLRYAEFSMATRMLIGGEFRRTLRAKARMAALSAALDRARSEDDWWLTLAGAAGDAGWARLVWLQGGAARREKDFSNEPGGWSFPVRLTAQESIRVDGGAHEDEDLPAFARIVRQSFAQGSRQWEQPKLT